MAADRDGERGSSTGVVAILVAVALVLLPMLYVLGLGPAVLLHKQGIAQKPIEIIYAPLEFAAEFLGPLRHPLDWYVELWE